MTVLASWNVNGIRAAQKKGFAQWLASSDFDIVVVQETKAMVEQLDQEITHPKGYTTYFQSAKRKGYSGVAAFCKKEPDNIRILGDDAYDDEGRVQILEYKNFSLVNCYFPNSQEAGARLDYKLGFCKTLHTELETMREQGKNLIITGDYNIAHTEIDLANPKTNTKNPGFLPEERAWMSQFLKSGYVDTFRMFNKDPGHYTWWTYRFKARERNVGWRIDYFCVNEEFQDRVTKATILSDVYGSDHCPVTLTIKD